MKLKRIRALFALLIIAFAVPFIIAFMYLFPRQARAIRRASSALLVRLLGLRVKFIGALDPEAKLLMMNHQGYLDIIFMESLHPKNLCWIAKKELGEVPLYGHALKAPRMILIDREDKKGLISLLKVAKERLSEGRVLAIFPEGTRSKGGEKLLPFKSGAKILAEKFELRFQPVVIVNSRSIFDLARLSVGGAEARFIALPSRMIPADSPDWYQALKEEMQACYLAHYKELNA